LSITRRGVTISARRWLCYRFCMATLRDSREPFEVVCDDGWTLRGEVVVGAPPVAVAVVGHAMMVDRRTLDKPRGHGFVSQLAARGIACVVADLRGHGRSGPSAAEPGVDWTYDELIEQDATALIGWTRARFAGLPLACVGHSLFAHVALGHVLRHPAADVAGLVLLACSVPNPDWKRRPIDYAAKRALIELMGVTTRVAGRLPVRRLGLGSDDEAAGYVRDFVRNARDGRWRARDGFDYFAALPSLKQPLLAMVGAGDRLLSPPADARGFVADVAHADFRVVGKASGLPFDPGHMGLVLDERARPAWDEVADFILRLAKTTRSEEPAAATR
jgi:predicted alpha/beta hydrolase